MQHALAREGHLAALARVAEEPPPALQQVLEAAHVARRPALRARGDRGVQRGGAPLSVECNSNPKSLLLKSMYRIPDFEFLNSYFGDGFRTSDDSELTCRQAELDRLGQTTYQIRNPTFLDYYFGTRFEEEFERVA